MVIPATSYPPGYRPPPDEERILVSAVDLRRLTSEGCGCFSCLDRFFTARARAPPAQPASWAAAIDGRGAPDPAAAGISAQDATLLKAAAELLGASCGFGGGCASSAFVPPPSSGEMRSRSDNCARTCR
jgi:hypothetical protein